MATLDDLIAQQYAQYGYDPNLGVTYRTDQFDPSSIRYTGDESGGVSPRMLVGEDLVPLIQTSGEDASVGYAPGIVGRDDVRQATAREEVLRGVPYAGATFDYTANLVRKLDPNASDADVFAAAQKASQIYDAPGKYMPPLRIAQRVADAYMSDKLGRQFSMEAEIPGFSDALGEAEKVASEKSLSWSEALPILALPVAAAVGGAFAPEIAGAIGAGEAGTGADLAISGLASEAAGAPAVSATVTPTTLAAKAAEAIGLSNEIIATLNNPIYANMTSSAAMNLATSLASGADFETAVKSALTGAATAGVTGGVTDITGSPVVGGAVGSGAGAVLTGGDIPTSVLGGALGSTVGQLAGEAIDPTTGKIIGSGAAAATTAALQDKDPLAAGIEAASKSAIGSAIFGGAGGEKTTSTDQVSDAGDVVVPVSSETDKAEFPVGTTSGVDSGGDRFTKTTIQGFLPSGKEYFYDRIEYADGEVSYQWGDENNVVASATPPVFTEDEQGNVVQAKETTTEDSGATKDLTGVEGTTTGDQAVIDVLTQGAGAGAAAGEGTAAGDQAVIDLITQGTGEGTAAGEGVAGVGSDAGFGFDSATGTEAGEGAGAGAEGALGVDEGAGGGVGGEGGGAGEEGFGTGGEDFGYGQEGTGTGVSVDVGGETAVDRGTGIDQSIIDLISQGDIGAGGTAIDQGVAAGGGGEVSAGQELAPGAGGEVLDVGKTVEETAPAKPTPTDEEVIKLISEPITEESKTTMPPAPEPGEDSKPISPAKPEATVTTPPITTVVRTPTTVPISSETDTSILKLLQKAYSPERALGFEQTGKGKRKQVWNIESLRKSLGI